MNINVRFSCQDIVGNLRDGDYDVPKDSTVRQAMEQFFAEDGRELTSEVENNVVFVINFRPAQWDTVLHEDDKLRILYRFLGG